MTSCRDRDISFTTRGLEISFTLTIFNTADGCSRIYDKMQELVKEYYMEPEDIIEDENEDIFLFLIIPGQLLILKTHIKCIVTNVTLSKIPFARYGFMWSPGPD